jgi:hypothetical protein
MSSPSHIFSTGLSGGDVTIVDRWRRPLSEFVEELKDYLGEAPRYHFWSYRRYRSCFFCLDMDGEKNSCALTFIETDELDSEGEVFSLGECMVSDAVDAAHLALYLVTRLGAQPDPVWSAPESFVFFGSNVK